MKRHLFAIASVAVVLLPAAGFGQSIYTQSQMNSIYRKNSVAGFSTSQLRYQTINRSVPQYSFSNVNRSLLNSASSMRAGSVRGAERGANVSPYLGLLADTPYSSTATNYYSLVRPQMEQQRMNERLQAQNIMLQRKLNDMAQQGPYETTGSSERAPTGHVAVYMNYGGYYTVPQGGGVRSQRR